MSTNPYFTPYKTQRFSFIGSPQQRDGTSLKDQRFINMYPELIKSPMSDGKKYYLKKRPGLDAMFGTIAGTARGIFFWETNGGNYVAVGSTLYFNATPLITGMSTTSGQVGFAIFRKEDNAEFLVVVDGVTCWLITPGNGITLVTSAAFPTPHVPTPIFMDGYLFLAKANTADIYNSDLDDPTSWTSDGFISAEMYPDNIVALVKNNNYIAAVGTESVEWLYDNANATGSPLQRNAPAVAQFGCPAALSIVQTEKEVTMIGDTAAGGRTIWKIDGFQPTELANEPVREALDQEGPNINFATAFCIQSAGHKWYVLNLTLHQRTFVYDYDEQMWHEWQDSVTGGCFRCGFATDGTSGNPTMLDSLTGVVYSFTPVNMMDNADPIIASAQTAKIDFDTIKRKRYYRLSLIGDSPDGDTNTPISVQFSDDDYTTWSTPRTLEINGDYPTITRMGLSRRRAYLFTFNQPLSLRLESFELDIVEEIRR